MQILTVETFAPCANEIFELELGDAAIAMTLVRITKLKPHPFPGMRRAPFRLTFKCARLTILPQKIYWFRNARLGRLSIFIVPAGRERDGIVYDATFN